MMSGLRNILWLLPLSLLLLWPLWRGPVGRFLAPADMLAKAGGDNGKKEAQAGQSFSMEGVSFLQQKNGVRDWQIEAARLHTGEDPDKMRLERVEAEVFQGERRKFRIVGKEGEYNSKQKLLTLKKDVQVHSEDGFLVLAEVLNYDDTTRNIWTRSPIRITGRNMDVRGRGLVYDMDEESYEVSGRVRVDSW
ncbi:LPS export ABC transporter periplasmic protein LptC [Thiovibrio sp. JS02]